MRNAITIHFGQDKARTVFSLLICGPQMVKTSNSQIVSNKGRAACGSELFRQFRSPKFHLKSHCITIITS